MKKLLLILALALSLMAEMSFDQVQELIKNRQYSKALVSLEVIQVNHPDESIVYYAQAQAKAGFGDLIGAKIALDKAKALNPKLTYAKPEAVKALEIAVEPRIDLVKTFEREDTKSYWIASFFGFVVLFIVGYWYFMFRGKPEEVVEPVAPYKPSEPYTTYKTTSAETTKRPETFSKGYGLKETFNTRSAPVYRPARTEVHHHHHNPNSNSGNTVAAGLAGVAAGVAVASMFDDARYSTQHEVDSLSRVLNPEPEDNSWADSNSSSDNSWADSNSSSDDSWSSSNNSSSDSWSSSNSSSGE